MDNYRCHETALVSPGSLIGSETRIWAFANIQPGAMVGSHCNICDRVYIEGGARVGNNVTLKNGVNVFDGVTIEDDVFVGANVAFINDRHPRAHRKESWVLEKTKICRGATIGSNATILCGVTIGSNAFVGAGSVVTKNVGDYALVAGNPAQFRSFVCRCGRKLPPDLKCCGEQYILTRGRLHPVSDNF